MPLSTQSQADDEQYVLVASLDNARNLSNILKAITFKDHAIFNATPNGLKVTVEDSKLSTFGNSGNAHYDYPKDSDMMELFQCTKTQTNRYKMSLLKPSTKALALSCKVSVRTDSRGFLSLQYLVRNDDGQICFVGITVVPTRRWSDYGASTKSSPTFTQAPHLQLRPVALDWLQE
uniref:Cell cycle checkpoint protein RAD1 n=1 Tax=Scophthalmus maximus TaxID=52904 RepID=A0A8D3CZ50_SCOMX